MKTQKNHYTLGLISGILFLIYMLLNISNHFNIIIDFFEYISGSMILPFLASLVFIVGFAVLVVCLLVKKQNPKIGIILLLVYAAMDFVRFTARNASFAIEVLADGEVFLLVLIFTFLLDVLYWLFLLLCVSKGKRGPGYAAAAVCLVNAVLSFFIKAGVVFVLGQVALIAAAVLLAAASEYIYENSKLPKTVPAASANPAVSTEDVATKLLKLKELRDNGIISQEEFEDKKKQIINI